MRFTLNEGIAFNSIDNEATGYKGIMADDESMIELVLDRRVIRRGERIGIQLVNRASVELMTGLPFTVEHWNGKEWQEIPEPEMTDWPMVGVNLAPNTRTRSQYWPHVSMETPAAGRYRVVKTARYEKSNSAQRDTVISATATFEIAP